MKFASKVSAFEAETRDVWKALSWVDTLGLNNIQVETDSMMTGTTL